MATWNTLPTIRVVTTAHTPKGEAIFEHDGSVQSFYPFGPQAGGFARIHSRLSVPVNNTSSPPDLAGVPPKCPPHGVLLCTADLPPHYTAPMHRTLTLDYAVIVAGEVVLRLESGEERTVRTGEVIVQKGVNHQWINRSDQACRMICAMLGAEKVVLEDGTALEEAFVRP